MSDSKGETVALLLLPVDDLRFVDLLGENREDHDEEMDDKDVDRFIPAAAAVDAGFGWNLPFIFSAKEELLLGTTSCILRRRKAFFNRVEGEGRGVFDDGGSRGCGGSSNCCVEEKGKDGREEEDAVAAAAAASKTDLGLGLEGEGRDMEEEEEEQNKVGSKEEEV